MFSMFILKRLAVSHAYGLRTSSGRMALPFPPALLRLGPRSATDPHSSPRPETLQRKELIDLSPGSLPQVAALWTFLAFCSVPLVLMYAMLFTGGGTATLFSRTLATVFLGLTFGLFLSRALPIRFISRLYDGSSIRLGLWNAELSFPRRECVLVVRMSSPTDVILPLKLYHPPSYSRVDLWPDPAEAPAFIQQWQQDNQADAQRFPPRTAPPTSPSTA